MFDGFKFTGFYPSYELCVGRCTVYVWMGMARSNNSFQYCYIKYSTGKGEYEYLFDRCIELGNDTVIILKDQVVKANKTYSDLINAADSNYYVYKETNEAFFSYGYAGNLWSCH